VSIAAGQRMQLSVKATPFQHKSSGSTAWTVDTAPTTRAEIPALAAPVEPSKRASAIRGQVLPGSEAKTSRSTLVHLIRWPTSIEFTEYVDVGAAGLAGTLAVAGADGHFAFEGVAPGTYLVRARDSAFGLAAYPSRPSENESKVVVREDTPTPDLLLPMTDVARLSVTVHDERGRPIAGASLRLNPRLAIPGDWVSRVGCKTNDRGECIVLGLEPGTYEVSIGGYRGPQRPTVREDFEDPRAPLPRFRGPDWIEAAINTVTLKPGERRVVTVVLPLAPRANATRR
jgi:hypothetical protein